MLHMNAVSYQVDTERRGPVCARSRPWEFRGRSARTKNPFMERLLQTHHRVSREDVESKSLHPDALVLAHPECRKEVLVRADFVGSTAQIIEYAKNSSHDKFLIATEMGILYKLKKDNPDKTFYLLTPGLVCPNMKKTSVESVYNALKYNRYEINLDKEVAERARRALEAMLAV